MDAATIKKVAIVTASTVSLMQTIRMFGAETRMINTYPGERG